MNTTTPRGWTQDQVDLVRDLWSAGETAETISRTLRSKYRCAVLGIVSRYGFKRAEGAGRKTPAHFVSRKRQSRKVLRQALTCHEQRHAPPITLSGPAWSVPAGARHVGRAA